MSLAPRADGRDAPLEVSPGAAAIPAASTPDGPGPRQGDGPPAQSVTPAGPGADQADAPTLIHPVDSLSTADALHWFG